MKRTLGRFAQACGGSLHGADRASDQRSDDSRQSQFPGLCDLQIGNDDGRDQRIKGMLQMEKLRSSESRYGRDCSPER